MGSFWNDILVEPKRKFRWLFRAEGLGSDAEWVAKSVKKPSWNVSEHPHKFINHTFHYPGRVEWQPIEATLVDVAQPQDASANLLGALRAAGYNFPTTLQEGSQTITKEQAVKALGRVTITQIGQDSNDILDEWTIVNGFITDCQLGDLDYEGDDIVEVSLTMVYDYAYMTKSGRGQKGWAGSALGAVNAIADGHGNPGKHDQGDG
jgi:hypothetical protein